MNLHTKRQNSDGSYLWSLNLVKPNTTLTIQSQLHKHRSVISASVSGVSVRISVRIRVSVVSIGISPPIVVDMSL